MQTFLGACTQLGPEDINMDYVSASQVVYMEGYLWDLPRAKQAMLDAAMKAKTTGVKVSLTLSDAFCVARFRDEFLASVEEGVAAAGRRFRLEELRGAGFDHPVARWFPEGDYLKFALGRVD